MTSSYEKTGKKREKIGKGHPPKKHQFTSNNQPKKKGRPKGMPNRSTLIRKILEMEATPPDAISRSLKAMYPDYFKSKSQRWENAFLMTARLVQKAIIKGDVRAFQVLMDYAYGKEKEGVDITSQGKPLSLLSKIREQEKSRRK